MRRSNRRKMKAYNWQDECRECGYIIYAENANQARSKVSQSKDIKYIDVHVKRAPWLDKYYGKEIPAKVMLEHGWWVMCPQCDCECALDNDTAVINHDKAYCVECGTELQFNGDLERSPQ